MSVVPPAENGTMNFTGRSGHAAAFEVWLRNGVDAKAAAPPARTERRVICDPECGNTVVGRLVIFPVSITACAVVRCAVWSALLAFRA